MLEVRTFNTSRTVHGVPLQILSFFGSRGIYPDVMNYNSTINMGAEARDKKILDFAVDGIGRTNLSQDGMMYNAFLEAAGLRDPAAAPNGIGTYDWFIRN